MIRHHSARSSSPASSGSAWRPAPSRPTPGTAASPPPQPRPPAFAGSSCSRSGPPGFDDRGLPRGDDQAGPPQPLDGGRPGRVDPGCRAAERAGGGPDRRRDRRRGWPTCRSATRPETSRRSRIASASCLSAPCASSTPPSSTTSSATACSTHGRAGVRSQRKVRQVSRRSRTGLPGSPWKRWPGPADIQIFSATETRRSECRRLTAPGPYGRIGRAVGVVGVLRATRMF